MNRLAGATSPYLLQHAENPVDWWPWGEEAFAEARRRDVPILLSVGYSACHWCHVMAHESFEDENTAAMINKHFVAIKVDREERPDVDAVYMEATVALNDGQGGWPMTVFATPEGEPFHCGTYYPAEARRGMHSFRQLMYAVNVAWNDRNDEVRRTGAQIAASLAAPRDLHVDGEPPTGDDLADAVELLAVEYDAVHGGFGHAPKFPPSMVLEFLLRHHARTGSEQALDLAQNTCEAMARGGIYDQLGGGFARYSVDEKWQVPHFEKMLYDNAQLIRVYTHLWRITGSEFARRIALETADFLLRELRTPEGAFASALDADSPDAEGNPAEGAYYAWTPAQLTDALGAKDGAWAAELFGVTDEGTFEHGMSVLQLPQDPASAQDAERFAEVRARLLAARAERVAPGRDDKVVAAWNGLAIAALAEAGTLFSRPDLLEAALAAADLLIAVHLGGSDDDEHGDRLVRTSRDGRPGVSAGVLEDYADVAEGFLALYAVTTDDAWLIFAGVMVDVVLGHFTDEDGALFDTADDAEELFRRPQDPSDGVTPSGWTGAAGALLGYATYLGSPEHREAAGRALGIVRALAGRTPRGIGWGLAVAEAWADGPREIAVVGPRDDDATWALYMTALMSTAPGAVVAMGDPEEDAPVPLLRDRTLIGGRPAAYVCRHFTCDAPVTDPEQLAEQVLAQAVVRP